MSYRELRNFCEIMRALGYPRLISMENFRKPNFELVADILFWLAQRYDPNTDISDDIDEEKHRVEFIKSVTMLFLTKARIRLNPKKLYQADGNAVQEILKVAGMLYKAYSSAGNEEEQRTDFALPTKLSNLKSFKSLAQEITDSGAKLHDLMEKEGDLKAHREKALQFLDNISNIASNSEQAYIEKNVREIVKQQTENIESMKKYVVNLERDEKLLEEKIRRQSTELDRAENRLKSLTNVRPGFMDEYERMEQELERLYAKYLEKFRNLDYLEHELDLYSQAEEEKFLESQKALKRMQDRIKDEEMRELRGEQEIDEGLLEQQLLRGDDMGSRAGSRAGVGRANATGTNFHKPAQGKQNQFQGSLSGPQDDDDDDQEDDDQEDDDDDDRRGGGRFGGDDDDGDDDNDF
mmetsp:Transcript_3464/g.3809  ORF Transcript_3464/g.3809 Transcript_3464/m.3809 type:complete len:408 (-) Transcript_3464:146-1369(-)|eukprot:CAMPEP_0176440616 /NCGR_PEP_ID=MMETSP0127-20121128/20682_1 /TAXON_ID=938130 /ORGANISM="Platyophrya macrostoma, Strain WH" /LENGTH=407 /DNA_ID=CAMNT_0017825185 /DNA_START=26 /DNA_END=1249 /DNA_ORIENTATION=+